MEFWGFWIAALALTGAALLLLLAALARGRTMQPGQQDLAVYRDQIREIERDQGRGLVDPETASRLKAEVSRRVLEADRVATADARPMAAPPGQTRALVVMLILLLAAGAVLYLRIGAPGYPDMAHATRIAQAEGFRATRPVQAEAEAEMAAQAATAGASASANTPAGAAPARPPADPAYLDQIADLRQAVASRPDDLQGQSLLTEHEAALGNFAAAARAQTSVVRLRGDQATARDQVVLAELLILAAGGYVSPEAEAALTAALTRDPRDPTARYYSGLLFAQIGRPDLAFRLWKPLLDESRPEEPWVAPLRAQIGQIAAMAGVRYEVPPETPLAGPSADQVEAAADMTPEARTEMIRGMVEGLSARLASDGGPAEEWARLITAYGVLGDTAQATRVWTEAQAVFAGRAGDMQLLRAAAEQAGVAE